MFVDTSAIIAILAGEPEADDFAARIAGAEHRYTSGLVVLEAAMRLSTILELDPVIAERGITAALREAGIVIVPIDGAIMTRAVAAFTAFGKWRHPARLNLADCMSYACAKAYDVPLLFKGDDFTRTDVQPA